METISKMFAKKEQEVLGLPKSEQAHAEPKWAYVTDTSAVPPDGKMKGMVYKAPYTMTCDTLPYPKMERPDGKKIPHAVILKVVVSCICGSDLHMYRGRTNVGPGMVFGHEITGQVIEVSA
jgi:hypothetical protein